mgnify:CR=1 FL=1
MWRGFLLPTATGCSGAMECGSEYCVGRGDAGVRGNLPCCISHFPRKKEQKERRARVVVVATLFAAVRTWIHPDWFNNFRNVLVAP